MHTQPPQAANDSGRRSRPDWIDARAYRPDPVELLREVGGEDRPLVSLPAKLLVAAVWVACTLYCIAIWTGFAQ